MITWGYSRVGFEWRSGKKRICADSKEFVHKTPTLNLGSKSRAWLHPPAMSIRSLRLGPRGVRFLTYIYKSIHGGDTSMYVYCFSSICCRSAIIRWGQSPKLVLIEENPYGQNDRVFNIHCDKYRYGSILHQPWKPWNLGMRHTITFFRGIFTMTAYDTLLKHYIFFELLNL